MARRGRRKLQGAHGRGGGGPPFFNLGLPNLGRRGKRGRQPMSRRGKR